MYHIYIHLGSWAHGPIWTLTAQRGLNCPTGLELPNGAELPNGVELPNGSELPNGLARAKLGL